MRLDAREAPRLIFRVKQPGNIHVASHFTKLPAGLWVFNFLPLFVLMSGRRGRRGPSKRTAREGWKRGNPPHSKNGHLSKDKRFERTTQLQTLIRTTRPNDGLLVWPANGQEGSCVILTFKKHKFFFFSFTYFEGWTKDTGTRPPTMVIPSSSTFFFYLSAFTIKFEKKNETPEFNRKRKRAQVFFSKALLAPPHPGNQELPQPKAPF